MRRALRPIVFGLFGLCLSPAAFAQDDFDDDDDFLFEGEDEEPDDTERLEEGDDLDVDDEGDESLDEFTDPEDDEEGGGPGDLLGEEDPLAPQSGDSAQLYRDTKTDLEKRPADEQLEGWEKYLTDYPNTPFRARIENSIAELESELYDTRIATEDGGVDAMDQEIKLAQALQLENIDPRTRLQIGVEWGLPAFVNMVLDYEYAVARNLSFHGGVRRRYSGWSIEPGVHYALVKSTRTNTLFTVLGDFRINANPAYPAFRPQLAFGKRFGELVDLQVQAGTDLSMRTAKLTTTDGQGVAETKTVFHPHIIGGLSATFAASETVKVFLETGAYMRSAPAGLLRYNTATFGMKFFPNGKPGKEDDLEVNMGASVPYTYNYWTYHYGSVMTQANLYMD